VGVVQASGGGTSEERVTTFFSKGNGESSTLSRTLIGLQMLTTIGEGHTSGKRRPGTRGGRKKEVVGGLEDFVHQKAHIYVRTSISIREGKKK